MDALGKCMVKTCDKGADFVDLNDNEFCYNHQDFGLGQDEVISQTHLDLIEDKG